MKSDLTQERLKELLRYDKKTGEFTRQKNIKGGGQAGQRAGTHHKKTGYRFVVVDGRRYKEHRLAWFFVKGVWPDHTIDHRDGVRNNNRWKNLRLATRTQNSMNTPIRQNHSTGVKGVYLHKPSGLYHARVKANGVLLWSRYFHILEDAATAIGAAREEHHGEFARHS